MYITKKLCVLTMLALAYCQQAHALKKIFRTRPGLEHSIVCRLFDELYSNATHLVGIIKEETTTAALWPVNRYIALAGFVGEKLLPSALKNGDIKTAKFLCSLLDRYSVPHLKKRLLLEIVTKAKDTPAYCECIAVWINKNNNTSENLKTKNSHGEFPLDIAFKRGLGKIATLLINANQFGPCFNKRNYDYHVLHYATEYRLFEVITYLMKDFGLALGNQGCLAKNQPQDSYGWTALHYASAKGDYAMCQFLLTLGCRPDITNHDGKTALELWPPNQKTEQYNKLVDFIYTRKMVPHCVTEDRYQYLKNLAIYVKKPTKNDITIYFKTKESWS